MGFLSGGQSTGISSNTNAFANASTVGLSINFGQGSTGSIAGDAKQAQTATQQTKADLSESTSAGVAVGVGGDAQASYNKDGAKGAGSLESYLTPKNIALGVVAFIIYKKYG